MAYVLQAVGALMVVAGIYAVATGYPIVQVEQGWASVIAGATLGAGGVVTVALGLILRALQQLKRVAATGTPAVSAAAIDHAEPAVARAEPPQGAALASQTMAEARPFAETALAPEPVPPIASSPDHVVATEPVPVVEFPLPSAEAHAPDHPSEVVPPPEFHQPSAPKPAPATPEPAPPPPAIEAAGASEAAPPTEGPAAPPMEDWLDRAFADLDRDLPPTPQPHVEPLREPLPEPAPPEAVMPEPAMAEAAESAAPHPAAAEAPSQPPGAAAAPTSAVIGRYEADGTSYVMYADGSIEAQSDAGVYRFASMAELKAFIES